MYDVLPNTALTAIASCASGGCRGYDELVPHMVRGKEGGGREGGRDSGREGEEGGRGREGEGGGGREGEGGGGREGEGYSLLCQWRV